MLFKKNKHFATRICVALAAAITPASCGLVSDTPELELGVILPLSGEYAHYGKETLRGMNVAVETLNSERVPAGLPEVKLQVIDTDSIPYRALAGYKKLVNRGFPLVIGPGPTDETRLLIHGVNDSGIPLLMPIASGDNITARGNSIYRVCITDGFQAQVLVDYMRNELGISELAVMIDLQKDASYGRNLAQAVSNKFKNAGGRVTITESFRDGAKSFTDQLIRVISRNPQAIFIPASASSSARFVREARLLGYEGWIVGSDSMAEPDFLNYLDGSSGNILFTSNYSPDDDTSGGRMMREAFQERSLGEPGDCEALGFDTILIAVAALERGETFADGWKDCAGLELVCGPLSFSSGNSVNRPVYLNIPAFDDEKGKIVVINVRSQQK